MKQGIDLNIEELVLYGFSPGDRYLIGQGVKHELTRLFTEQGIPSPLSQNRKGIKMDAESFKLFPGSKPERIGYQIARSVFKGFKE